MPELRGQAGCCSFSQERGREEHGDGLQPSGCRWLTALLTHSHSSGWGMVWHQTWLLWASPLLSLPHHCLVETWAGRKQWCRSRAPTTPVAKKEDMPRLLTWPLIFLLAECPSLFPYITWMVALMGPRKNFTSGFALASGDREVLPPP